MIARARASGPPPGNLDPFNVLRARFASADAWGVPLLLREAPEPPDVLVPYKTRVRTDTPLQNAAVHFFLDDPNFEPVWNRPTKGLSYVARFGRALTPDFSLFTGFPPAVQLMQVYKNRWCGRFWQDNGVRVVPTISWSDRRSYPFAFAGVPKGSVVAISTVGLGGATAREASLFRAGYGEMVRVLDPELVLVYGEVPLERFGLREEDGPPVRTYPSRWGRASAPLGEPQTSAKERSANFGLSGFRGLRLVALSRKSKPRVFAPAFAPASAPVHETNR